MFSYSHTNNGHFFFSAGKQNGQTEPVEGLEDDAEEESAGESGEGQAKGTANNKENGWRYRRPHVGYPEWTHGKYKW